MAPWNSFHRCGGQPANAGLPESSHLGSRRPDRSPALPLWQQENGICVSRARFRVRVFGDRLAPPRTPARKRASGDVLGRRDVRGLDERRNVTVKVPANVPGCLGGRGMNPPRSANETAAQSGPLDPASGLAGHKGKAVPGSNDAFQDSVLNTATSTVTMAMRPYSRPSVPYQSIWVRS